MAHWHQFVAHAPELSAFGYDLLSRFGMAYLGTVRKDGSPRVHPVSPMFVDGGLYVGIIATSPKRYDLLRDGRYVLHALPGPNNAEFSVRGRAILVDDPQQCARITEAVASVTITAEDDMIFELDILQAIRTIYETPDEQTLVPIHTRWDAPAVIAITSDVPALDTV